MCYEYTCMIPTDICQFWYTTALFRPVIVNQKVRKFAQIVQNFAFSKKFTTASADCANQYELWSVVHNIRAKCNHHHNFHLKRIHLDLSWCWMLEVSSVLNVRTRRSEDGAWLRQDWPQGHWSSRTQSRLVAPIKNIMIWSLFATSKVDEDVARKLAPFKPVPPARPPHLARTLWAA